MSEQVYAHAVKLGLLLACIYARSGHAIDHSNKKKKLSSPNLKIMGEEIEEHNSIPTVDDIVLGSSSNPEGERTDHGKEVKVLPTLFCP